MVLRNGFAALLGAALLSWSSLAPAADEYRPGQFLGLDLSSAVLSPKPLGPPAEFVPGPLDVTADHGNEGVPASAQASSEPKAAAQAKAAAQVIEPKATPKIVAPRTRIAHLRSEQPHGAARTRLARHRGNPLDAQAFDTRIQVWPCRSGGICNWRPQRH
jgi:hypothetical protein